MLDYKIYTFLKVCETLNFTLAAQELHITQPAVTKHIRALEVEYGCKLFVFENKTCVMTKQAVELKNMLNSMINDIHHYKYKIKTQSKTLNFGATMSIGEYVVGSILSEMMLKDKDLKINMIVENTETLLHYIDSGKIDFALIEGCFSQNQYDSLRYKKEDFVAVCSSNYQLEIHDNTMVDINSLLQETVLVREEGSGTREVLELALKERNIFISDFNHICEIGSLNVIKKLVMEGRGISFFYRSVVEEELKNGQLKQILIDDFYVQHDFTFVWRKNSFYSEEYRSIFDMYLE